MRSDAWRSTLISAGVVAAVVVAVFVAGGRTKTPAPADGSGNGGDGIGREPGDVAHPMDGAGVGPSRGGHFEFDRSVDYAGRRILFREWQAAWRAATPRESDDPDNPDIHAEDAELTFYPGPSATNPDPRAVLGPGATTARSRRADIARGATGRVHAELNEEVHLERYEEARGETASDAASVSVIALETESLTLDRQGPTNDVTAATDAPVVIRNGPDEVHAVGMTSDSGLARAELRSHVNGTFTMEGGPLDLESDGPGLVEALDRRPGVPVTERRLWRVTFRENVRAVQGSLKMSCRDSFVVEMPLRARAAGADDLPDEIRRLEAHGDFKLAGEGKDGPFSIAADSVRRWREDGDHDVMEFLGGTDMVFQGRLGPARSGPEVGGPSRLRIVCKGPVTYRDRPHPDPVMRGLRRFTMVFEDDVIVTQEDLATGAQVSRLEAPKVTLFGNRDPAQVFDPRVEHLTAEGGVHLVHRFDEVKREGAFDARAASAAWMENRTTGERAYALVGSPQVRFFGRAGFHVFGAAPAEERDSTFILTCDDEVTIRERPIPDDPRQRVATSMHASVNVKLRKIVDETEPLRITAQVLDAAFDPDGRLASAVASGDATIEGRAEDGSGRRGAASGDKIVINDQGRPAEDGIPTSATIEGRRDKPALAVVYDVEDGAPVQHHIQGEKIEYRARGTVILATGTAIVTLSRPDGTALVRGSDFEDAGSSLQLSADSIRADLAPRRPTTGKDPELLRLHAEGGRGARLSAAKGQSVSGDVLDFDAVTGVASATGRPARAEWTPVSKGEPLTSFVLSPAIRAVLSTTKPDAGRLERVTCDGGTIHAFLVARASDDPAAAVAPPRRTVVTAKGPISVGTRSGTAEKDVLVVIETLEGPRWERRGEIQCDRLELTFDPAAQGGTMSQVTKLLATGSADRVARFVSPALDGSADRIEARGTDNRVHLSSTSGRRVKLSDKESKLRYRCVPSCWIDYSTKEWESQGTSEVIVD